MSFLDPLGIQPSVSQDRHNMKNHVKVLQKEHVLSGRIFDLERHRLHFPNGYEVNLELIRHPGASAVVPLLDLKTVLMIKQYRYAVGDYILEIPAGTLKQNEDPLTCARRELEEETGYHSQKLIHLGMIYPLPGYSDERIHIYLALELRKATQNLDQDEIISLMPLGLEEALRMVSSGEIVDGKSICGLFMAKAYLEGDHGRE